MKYLKQFSILILALIISSCANTTSFVVLRDVPNNPSLTVLPANDYLSEVVFATNIESYIIQSGIRVLQRPGSKEVQTTKTVSQAGGQTNLAAESGATLTERYYSLDESKADYLIYTYASSRQIKIVKKETSEILSTFILPLGSGYIQNPEAGVILESLKSLGLPVRLKDK